MKPHQYEPSSKKGCRAIVDGKRCGKNYFYQPHYDWEQAQPPTKQERLANIRGKIECPESVTDPSILRGALIELLELLEEAE